jgi:hypothetical protein
MAEQNLSTVAARHLGAAYAWSDLSSLQVGRYAEYFVKMELTLLGFEVYSSEVDDRGIDFVARRGPAPFLEFQVKSVREKGYIFLPKHKTALSPTRVVAAVVFKEGAPPAMYLIPTVAWRKPDGLLVDYEYEGRKSKPEYGLNVSAKYAAALERFRSHLMVEAICGGVDS